MDALFTILDTQTEAVVDLQTKLTAIPALGPKNGGDGEKAKAEFLLSHLKNIGIKDVRELKLLTPRFPAVIARISLQFCPVKTQKGQCGSFLT